MSRCSRRLPRHVRVLSVMADEVNRLLFGGFLYYILPYFLLSTHLKAWGTTLGCTPALDHVDVHLHHVTRVHTATKPR